MFLLAISNAHFLEQVSIFLEWISYGSCKEQTRFNQKGKFSIKVKSPLTMNYSEKISVREVQSSFSLAPFTRISVNVH